MNNYYDILFLIFVSILCYVMGYMKGMLRVLKDFQIATKVIRVYETALNDIRDLDPFPNTDKFIRKSHERHLTVAKSALAEADRIVGNSNDAAP